MIDIASKHIIPAVLQYTTALASSVNQIREACAEANISVQIELLKECSSLLAATKAALKELTEVTDTAGTKAEGRERAVYIKDIVVPAMEALRRRWTGWRCWWPRTCGPCPLTAICFLRYKRKELNRL